MGRSSLILIFMLFTLLVSSSSSWNYYDDDASNEQNNIGVGMRTMTNKNEGDGALNEFTLAAGSHINLLLWQFILWQVGFVVIGMCLCGFSVLIFNKCCVKE